ncbi:MAG: winged helix-turn-helix transcriptional regulator [Candidatus Thermoplasmatota archaeon]
MHAKSVAILGLLSSPTCDKVLACLRAGLDHPEEISKKLGVVRQTVDWHLLRLSALGIVERVAVSSLSGRPRVIYKLSPEGKEMTEALDSALTTHLQKVQQRFERQEHELDVMLANGEITEEVYNERMHRLSREREIVGDK